MSTQVFPTTPGGGGGGTPATTVVTTNTFGQASAVGTSTDYARADHVHGSPAAPAVIQSDGWFGHGIDGDLTVSGTTTLTRNSFYNNLTITSTGVLKPAGWRIYVLGTLTIDSGGTMLTVSSGAKPALDVRPATQLYFRSKRKLAFKCIF